MAITFDLVSNTVGRTLTTRTESIESFTASMDPNSTQDLLRMQQLMQEWTILTDLQSTLVKEIGDALKGIVQKSG